MLKATDIQRAIYTVLSTADDVGLVLDHDPHDPVYPYSVMSDHIGTEWDTDSSEGLDIVQTIDIWSQYVGNAEVKGIMNAIYTALHHQEDALNAVLQETAPELHITMCEMQRDQLLTDPTDNLTRHGILDFHLLVESV